MRSPGHIVHVNLKEDNDNSESHYYHGRSNEDFETNPESQGLQIKYDFQESPADLKQVG